MLLQTLLSVLCIFSTKLHHYQMASRDVMDRGVVVNFDLGEQFPRPGSQQWGSLHPSARRVAVRGGGVGGGRPIMLGGRGCHPRKIFLRFLLPNPALGGATLARK